MIFNSTMFAKVNVFFYEGIFFADFIVSIFNLPLLIIWADFGPDVNLSNLNFAQPYLLI
jgi:hypothetical protein